VNTEKMERASKSTKIRRETPLASLTNEESKVGKGGEEKGKNRHKLLDGPNENEGREENGPGLKKKIRGGKGGKMSMKDSLTT